MSTHLLLRFARRSVACTRFFRPLSTFGGLVSRSVVARPQFVVPFHLKATSSSSRNTARFSSKSAISSTRPRRRYRAAAWSTSSIRRISATSPIGRNGSTVEKPIRKFSARFSINTFPRAWIYIYIYMIVEGIVDGRVGERLKTIVPLTNLNMTTQLSYMLDGLLPSVGPPVLEAYFIQALCWSLGAGLLEGGRA